MNPRSIAMSGLPGMRAQSGTSASSSPVARYLPKARVLPGFGLSLGFTLVYLSLIVLIPLSATFIRAAQLSWPAFVDIVTAPRALASYWLTFGASWAQCPLSTSVLIGSSRA